MLQCAAVVLFLLDSSGSIDGEQWRDMVRGHSEALVHERVIRVIENDNPIAVAFYGFADRTYPILDFRVLRTRQDVEQTAYALSQSTRPSMSWTMAGTALSQAVKDITESAPCATDNPIVDIVSDGESPDYSLAEQARDRAQALGIRINVLGVGEHAFKWLNDHARTADGFYIGIESMDDIVPSLRRKIVYEIAYRSELTRYR